VQSGNPNSGGRQPLLWTLVGTTLGLGLLYASTRKIDGAALVATLKSVEWPWVCGILGATLAFIAIKAWRWAILLRFIPGLRFRELHSAVYIGLAINFLIAHVGEFLRTAIVARGHQVAVSTVFASVVIERVLDFIALLLLLALIVALMPDPPDLVAAAAAFSGGFVLLAVAGLYLLMQPPAWATSFAAFIGRPLPERWRERIRRELDRFTPGLAPLRNPQLLLLAILVSVLQWALVILAIWCSGVAVGTSVSLVAATVTFVLIIIGLTLPNSPLQIGTTQLAFVLGVGTDGTGATAAIAASLLYTAFLIIPIMLVGGGLMLWGQANIGRLRRIRV